MTVPVEPLGKTYLCDGQTARFDVPFSYGAPADIIVTRTLATDGSEVRLAQSRDFAVVLVEQRPVVQTTTIYPDGDRLTVDRDTAPTQAESFITGGDFPAVTINWALDKLTRMIAELKRALKLTVRLPSAWLGAALVLPGPAPLQAIGWNASGTALTNLPIAGVTESGLVLPFATSESMGLIWDGTTDAGPVIQRTIADLAARGGGSILLQPPKSGGTLRTNGKIRVFGGVNLLGPCTIGCGRYGGVAVHGKVAAAPGVDNLRLTADVTAGTRVASLDTSLLAVAGPLSSSLSPGRRLTFIGKKDSCGTPIEWQDAGIVSIDDGAGTVTIDQDFAYSFKVAYPAGDYETAWGTPDATVVQLQITARLAQNYPLGCLSVQIVADDVGIVQPFQWVAIEDDGVAGDVAGTSTARTHRMLAQVRLVEGAFVTLDRWNEQPLLTAKNARLTVIDTVTGTIEGPTLVFTDPVDVTDPAPAKTVEMAYAVGGRVYDVTIPNTDDFGSRGDALRHKLTAGSWFIGCEVSYPKFYDAGRGYGGATDWCTDGGYLECRFRGCRHSIVFSGSTRAWAIRPESYDCLVADFDFHGSSERSCVVVEPKVVGGYKKAEGSRAALSFGNSFHLAGSHNCVVERGRVEHYRSPQTVPGVQDYETFGVSFEAPSTNCRVVGTDFRDVDKLVQSLENNSYPNLVINSCGLDGCTLDGCFTYVAWIEGSHYHATTPGVGTYAIQNFFLRNLDLKNVSRLFRFTRITGLDVSGLRIDGVTVAGDEPYLARCNDVSGRIARCDAKGCGKGPQLTSCQLDIYGNDWRSFTTQVVLGDQGGNVGSAYRNNRTHGFTPQVEVGTYSQIIYSPRTPDSFNVADGAMITFKPPVGKGVCKVWTLSGDFVRANYQVDVSPAVCVAEDGDANAATANGTAAVGLGLAGKLTLVADPAGVLAVVNKRGGQRGTFWAFLGEP